MELQIMLECIEVFILSNLGYLQVSSLIHCIFWIYCENGALSVCSTWLTQRVSLKVEDETCGARCVKCLSWFPPPSSNSRCCQSRISLTVLHVLGRADNPAKQRNPQQFRARSLIQRLRFVDSSLPASGRFLVHAGRKIRSITYLKRISRGTAPQAELINTHSERYGLQTWRVWKICCGFVPPSVIL